NGVPVSRIWIVQWKVVDQFLRSYGFGGRYPAFANEPADISVGSTVGINREGRDGHICHRYKWIFLKVVVAVTETGLRGSTHPEAALDGRSASLGMARIKNHILLAI